MYYAEQNSKTSHSEKNWMTNLPPFGDAAAVL
jgi:hypothetical protein